MPQNSQILGVNSVTNIELDKGVMPAPIIRNADWFEKIACPPICPRPGVRELARLCVARRALHADPIIVSYLVQDSGKLPIY
ncbi:hypothetical protein F2A37_22350 [Pseudomonas chlororaphis]|nr:hypothetical protein F2A37_22350 [Pseudomonas chlororaphis]KAB0534770.1 hypothetical protein F7R16_04975 [Pseudomonas chlororaphis subsp. aureofaciens]QHC91143.1 hypothetical protein PchlR47_23550 [Pseudomonas chlororaphis]TSD28364.1 hypothetical protein FCE86_001900 [Pseudomonas sp. ATCC 13985]